VGHAYSGQRHFFTTIKQTATRQQSTKSTPIKCKDAARGTEASSNPLTVWLREQSAIMEESRERQYSLLFSCSDNMFYSMDLSRFEAAAQDASGEGPSESL
jgi:hypothetical protein